MDYGAGSVLRRNHEQALWESVLPSPSLQVIRKLLRLLLRVITDASHTHSYAWPVYAAYG